MHWSEGQQPRIGQARVGAEEVRMRSTYVNNYARDAISAADCPTTSLSHIVRERLRAQSALIARRENLRLASEQLEDLQHRTSDPFASTSAASSRAQDIVQLRAEWQRVAAALTEARQSACLQAVDMWHLQAVDTAAPLFFDPATEAASNQKQDDGYILCQIGGCVLPPVKDLKRKFGWLH